MVETFSGIQNVVTLVMGLKKSWADRRNIDYQSLVNVTILNWVAPCTIKSATQYIQGKVAGFLANEIDGSIVSVLMPTFTHRKGTLWLAEKAALDMLVSCGLNFDACFCLAVLCFLRPKRTQTPCLLRSACMQRCVDCARDGVSKVPSGSE